MARRRSGRRRPVDGRPGGARIAGALYWPSPFMSMKFSMPWANARTVTRPSAGRNFWLTSVTVQPPLTRGAAALCRRANGAAFGHEGDSGAVRDRVAVLVGHAHRDSRPWCRRCRQPSILYCSALIDIDFWIGRPVDDRQGIGQAADGHAVAAGRSAMHAHRGRDRARRDHGDDIAVGVGGGAERADGQAAGIGGGAEVDIDAGQAIACWSTTRKVSWAVSRAALAARALEHDRMFPAGGARQTGSRRYWPR